MTNIVNGPPINATGLPLVGMLPNPVFARLDAVEAKLDSIETSLALLRGETRDLVTVLLLLRELLPTPVVPSTTEIGTGSTGEEIMRAIRGVSR